MINLYVKFNVHSSYVKQVIVLKIGGQTDGQTRLVTTIGIRKNFGWGLKNVEWIVLMRKFDDRKWPQVSHF